MSKDLLLHYNQLVKTKIIKKNNYQLELIKKLNNIKKILEENNKKFIKKKLDKYSLYIYGDVGRGKTFIMDMLYQHIEVKKHRIHFHNFMNEIQQELHNVNLQKKNNPIREIAKNHRNKYKLLFLDEFSVNDIADAMILEQIFYNFAKYKIFIVTTSNRHPKNLYKGGLQREKYLNFVKYLTENSDIIRLQGEIDFRTENINELENNYIHPINLTNKKKFINLFNKLTSNAKTESRIIKNKGRNLIIHKTSKNIAIIDFNEFCKGNYSSSDYQKISINFDIIFLNNIEVIDDRNIAKRFINLIDILYENKTKVIFLAESKIIDIYNKEQYKFEFQRTISRIKEMQKI